MAKSARPAKPKKQKGAAGGGPSGNPSGGRSVVWLSGLACGVGAAVAPGTGLLLSALLAPGLLALRIDRDPGRPVARTVLTCGLAGCVKPVISLWNAGQSFDAAIAIATDISALSVAWSAAAAGWLATQLTPLAVRAALEAAALTRITALRIARGKIIEAWGLPEGSQPEDGQQSGGEEPGRGP